MGAKNTWLQARKRRKQIILRLKKILGGSAIAALIVGPLIYFGVAAQETAQIIEGDLRDQGLMEAQRAPATRTSEAPIEFSEQVEVRKPVKRDDIGVEVKQAKVPEKLRQPETAEMLTAEPLAEEITNRIASEFKGVKEEMTIQQLEFRADGLSEKSIILNNVTIDTGPAQIKSQKDASGVAMTTLQKYIKSLEESDKIAVLRDTEKLDQVLQPDAMVIYSVANNNGKWYVEFKQYHNMLPVFDGNAKLIFTEKKKLLVLTDNIRRNLPSPDEFRVGTAVAQESTKELFEWDDEFDRVQYINKGYYKEKPIYKVEADAHNPLGRWDVYVNGVDGSVEGYVTNIRLQDDAPAAPAPAEPAPEPAAEPTPEPVADPALSDEPAPSDEPIAEPTDETVPVDDDEQPIADETGTSEDETVPVDDDEQPIADETGTAEDETVPVDDDDQPIVDETAEPIADEPTPTDESATPEPGIEIPATPEPEITLLQTLLSQVFGIIYPKTPNDLQETQPFANQYVYINERRLTTDEQGYFDNPGMSWYSLFLEGPYVTVMDGDATANIDIVDQTPEDPFTWDENSASLAAINTFYHINKIRQWAAENLKYEINYAIPVTVNSQLVDQYLMGCGAWFDTRDKSIEIGRGGYEGEIDGVRSPCMNDLNYALSSDIIYHEYAHNIVESITHLPNIKGAESAALGEGLADYFAATINDDPLWGDVITVRTRNLQNMLTYQDDMTGTAHYDGQIFSGALWDLRQAIGAEKTDKLVYNTLYQGRLHFETFMYGMIIEDDDNEDFSDGTPHLAEILTAFEKHGIGPGVENFTGLPISPEEWSEVLEEETPEGEEEPLMGGWSGTCSWSGTALTVTTGNTCTGTGIISATSVIVQNGGLLRIVPTVSVGGSTTFTNSGTLDIKSGGKVMIQNLQAISGHNLATFVQNGAAVYVGEAGATTGGELLIGCRNDATYCPGTESAPVTRGGTFTGSSSTAVYVRGGTVTTILDTTYSRNATISTHVLAGMTSTGSRGGTINLNGYGTNAFSYINLYGHSGTTTVRDRLNVYANATVTVSVNTNVRNENNQGAWLYNYGGSYTTENLHVGNAATTSSDARVYNSSAGTFTVNGNAYIYQEGDLYHYNTTANSFTVGYLYLQGTSVKGGTFYNYGSFKVNSTATIRDLGYLINYGDGVINALTVNVGQSTTVVGGTIYNYGDFDCTGNMQIYRGTVTNTEASNFDVAGTLTIGGASGSVGTLSIYTEGNPSKYASVGSLTVNSYSTINVYGYGTTDADRAKLYVNGTTSLANLSTLNVGNSSDPANYRGEIQLNNTLTLNSGSALNLYANSRADLKASNIYGTFTNNGASTATTATVAGTLDARNGTLSVGTLTVNSGGTANAGLSTTQGVLNVGTGGATVNSGGKITTSGTNTGTAINVNGTLNINAGSTANAIIANTRLSAYTLNLTASSAASSTLTINGNLNASGTTNNVNINAYDSTYKGNINVSSTGTLYANTLTLGSQTPTPSGGNLNLTGGSIRATTIAVNNIGIITANSGTSYIYSNPTTFNVNSGGTLSLGSEDVAATLNIYSPVNINSGGKITTIGYDGTTRRINIQNTLTINGGSTANNVAQYTSLGTAALNISGNLNLTGSGSTATGVTVNNGGILNVGYDGLSVIGSDLAVSGAVTVTSGGLLRLYRQLGDVATDSWITIGTNLNIFGSGSVILSSRGGQAKYSSVGGLVYLNGNVSGHVGEPSLQISGAGTQLNITGITYLYNGNSATNTHLNVGSSTIYSTQAIFTSSNGGKILNTGTINVTNTGEKYISLVSGSVIDNQGTITLNGQRSSADNPMFTVASGASVTNTGTMTLNGIETDEFSSISGSVNNSGTFHLVGLGTKLRMYGSSNFTNNSPGELKLDGSTSDWLYMYDTSTLTNNAGATVEVDSNGSTGDGRIYVYGTDSTNRSTLTNYGTINTRELILGTTPSIYGGTINNEDGGVFNVNYTGSEAVSVRRGGTINNKSGITGGKFVIAGQMFMLGDNVAGGTVLVNNASTATAAFDVPGTIYLNSYSTLTNSGIFNANNTTLSLNGNSGIGKTINNTGEMNLKSAVDFAGTNINNTGSGDLNINGNMTFQSGTFTNESGATFDLIGITSELSVLGAGIINNAGTINVPGTTYVSQPTLGNSGVLTNHGTFITHALLLGEEGVDVPGGIINNYAAFSIMDTVADVIIFGGQFNNEGTAGFNLASSQGLVIRGKDGYQGKFENNSTKTDYAFSANSITVYAYGLFLQNAGTVNLTDTSGKATVLRSDLGVAGEIKIAEGAIFQTPLIDLGNDTPTEGGFFENRGTISKSPGGVQIRVYRNAVFDNYGTINSNHTIQMVSGVYGGSLFTNKSTGIINAYYLYMYHSTFTNDAGGDVNITYDTWIYMSAGLNNYGFFDSQTIRVGYEHATPGGMINNYGALTTTGVTSISDGEFYNKPDATTDFNSLDIGGYFTESVTPALYAQEEGTTPNAATVKTNTKYGLNIGSKGRFETYDKVYVGSLSSTSPLSITSGGVFAAINGLNQDVNPIISVPALKMQTSSSFVTELTLGSDASMTIRNPINSCKGISGYYCSIEIGTDTVATEEGSTEINIFGTLIVNNHPSYPGNIEIGGEGHGHIDVKNLGNLTIDETGTFYIRTSGSDRGTLSVNGTATLNQMPMDVYGDLNVGLQGDAIGGELTVANNLTVRGGVNRGTVTHGKDGTVTVSGSTTDIYGYYELDGTLNSGDLTVYDGGHVSSGLGSSTNFYINATSVDVQLGGKISSDGACDFAPMEPVGKEAGTYGGEGIGTRINTYGNVKLGGSTADHSNKGSYLPTYGTVGQWTDPVYDISYAGGGVYIRSTGDIKINGIVSANGADNNNAGQATGSGGSVIIEQDVPHSGTGYTFTGSGYIRANGGNSTQTTTNPGGGGRILIESILLDYPDNGSGSEYVFNLGNIKALGGNNTSIHAAAGTIVFLGDDNNPNGSLLVDQGGNEAADSKVTRIPDVGDRTFDRVEAGNWAKITYEATNLPTAPTSCFKTGTGTPSVGQITCTPNPDKPHTMYINDSVTGAQLGTEPAGASPLEVNDLTPVFSVVHANPEISSTVNKLRVQITDDQAKFNDSANYRTCATCTWDADVTLSSPTSTGSRSVDFIYGGPPLLLATTYYIRTAFYDNAGTNLGLWTHRDMGNHYNFEITAYILIEPQCSGNEFNITNPNPPYGNIATAGGKRFGKGTCPINVATSYSDWAIVFGMASGTTDFADTFGRIFDPIYNSLTCSMDPTGNTNEEKYAFNVSNVNIGSAAVELIDMNNTCSGYSFDFDADLIGTYHNIHTFATKETIITGSTAGTGSFDLNLYANMANKTVPSTYTLDMALIITTSP